MSKIIVSIANYIKFFLERIVKPCSATEGKL